MNAGREGPRRGFRHYDFCVAGMVTFLLCANLIGPGKVCTLELPLSGAVAFGAGNLFFPISYIFDDVLTEVVRLRAFAPRDLGRLRRHAVRQLHVAEGMDIYDRDTDFTPLTLRDEGEVHRVE